jgi:hypothetical protein
MNLVWQVLRRAVHETLSYFGLNAFTAVFGGLSLLLGFAIYHRVRDSDAVTDWLVGTLCFSVVPFVALLLFNIWRGPYLIARDKDAALVLLQARVEALEGRRPKLELAGGTGEYVKDAGTGRPTGALFFKIAFKNRGEVEARNIEGRILIVERSATGALKLVVNSPISRANPVGRDGDLPILTGEIRPRAANSPKCLLAFLLHYSGPVNGDWYAAAYYFWEGTNAQGVYSTKLLDATLEDTAQLKTFLSAHGIDTSRY